MKNHLKLIQLLILPAIILTISSCTIGQGGDEKIVDVYDLDVMGETKNSGHVGEVKALFRSDQYYVPYLSLDQYAELYEPHFASKVSSSVSKFKDLITWTVTLNNQLYFISQIDTANKTVLYGGSLEAVLKQGDNPIDTAALTYAAVTDYDGMFLENDPYAVFSYADIELDTITSFGNVYFPLGFLDVTYSSISSVYFYYNYAGIYSTHNVDNYFLKTFDVGGQTLTVNKEMAKNKKTETMPDYLKKYNANMFMYLLDNFYGLKDYKNINKAKEYCETIGTYNKLFSDNDAERAQAYADTLSKLDDNHTALVAANETWGEQSFDPRQYGDGCKSRSQLRTTLSNYRTNSMDHTYYAQNNEPVFSSDGETAMFLFDSFIFGTSEQVFNADGSIKEGAEMYDSFISISKMFQGLVKKGGVKNVILDMATNGGGVLGVLMKLLALISRDNISELFYLEASTQQVGIASTRVDTNLDGKYDKNDCYGDDFNIYLLTSDCSFSCGNAFPFLAKRKGTAKIIGEKSGGGECSVGTHYLPNGEYVYHSSPLHIGYFNQNTNEFFGSESGAKPDISIQDYNDYFNIDRLASYISAN